MKFRPPFKVKISKITHKNTDIEGIDNAFLSDWKI